MTTIHNQIRQYVDDNFLLGARDLQYGNSDSLLDLHILDSTGVLELILFLEQTWGIQVADTEMLPENLDSVDAIAAYVQRKQAIKTAA
ncbi:D-alanine--poly(phosphoribitol) ligase subunit 2 [mine drainage metagenome]|uniref:D-alanine--poly(Phosphoribitol) ligase subunit 2 n=1 Tax=mine drainage metagenome TaxID=410659 RepID=A0A1J5PV53_9ZZZZ